MHESRHKHAMSRKRGKSGQFDRGSVKIPGTMLASETIRYQIDEADKYIRNMVSNFSICDVNRVTGKLHNCQINA